MVLGVVLLGEKDDDINTLVIMKIENLKYTNIDTIVDCFNQSFEGYFVKMPTEVDFWKNRFESVRVDYELSYGVFDKDKLVGFMIHGIDDSNDKNGLIKTAYNTGTGVISAYRGNQLVDKMYDFAIPLLKIQGVKKCKLEVIDKNERAIKVYERIGFENKRRMKCYRGEFTDSNKQPKIQKIDVEELKELMAIFQSNHSYSWNNTLETIIANESVYDSYKVFGGPKTELIGYFVINPKSGYVAQLESIFGGWTKVFEGISQVNKSIRINDIDDTRIELLNFLNNHGFTNTVDQFEMEMML